MHAEFSAIKHIHEREFREWYYPEALGRELHRVDSSWVLKHEKLYGKRVADYALHHAQVHFHTPSSPNRMSFEVGHPQWAQFLERMCEFFIGVELEDFLDHEWHYLNHPFWALLCLDAPYRLIHIPGVDIMRTDFLNARNSGENEDFARFVSHDDSETIYRMLEDGIITGVGNAVFLNPS